MRLGEAASFGVAQLGEIIAAIGPALKDIPHMGLADWIGALSAAGGAYAAAYVTGNPMVGVLPGVVAFAAYVVALHRPPASKPAPNSHANQGQL